MTDLKVQPCISKYYTLITLEYDPVVTSLQSIQLWKFNDFTLLFV